MTHQTEKLHQVRSFGNLNERQRIKPARFLGCNGNVRRAFQASIRRALLSSLSKWGTLEPSKGTSLVPQGAILLFEACHKLQLGKASGAS